MSPSSEKKEKEKEFQCLVGSVVLEDGRKIPVGICKMGEAFELRVVDKSLLEKLFKEEKEAKK